MTALFALCAAALAESAGSTAASVTDGAVVEPIPLADVALAGDWKVAEDRNQEVGVYLVQVHNNNIQ